MADEATARKLDAFLLGAEPDGAGVLIRYGLVRGVPPELEDRVPLGAAGDLASVHGVGRVLRVLRAGRVKAPADPYALGDDPETTAALLRQCRGALVTLHVAPRFERMLTVWTEEGVHRIDRVVDVTENDAGLSVRRRGGGSALRIPRQSLIRYSLTTRKYPEIISVEVPTKASLR
jgi:hypothetical protein